MLGAVEVADDGGPRPLGGPAQRLLLAVLVAQRPSVVSTDALAEALWGDAPPATARATLQTHLSKLRRAIGDDDATVVVRRPPGYALAVGPEVVDADRFAAAVAAAREAQAEDPRSAAGTLDGALDLWRGPAFAEFADAPWARVEAVRLDELRLLAVEDRDATRLALGEHALVVASAEGIVAEHPLRERSWGHLVTALHRSGRQAEALRTAHAFRRHLGDELGLEPSAAFVAVERAAVADAPGPIESGPAPPSWGAATTIVGRADELERLAAALDGTRVLTLTGTGGVGKSTVAAELVRRAAGELVDGARVVELAAVVDGSAVVAAVAHVLDVERRAERSLVDAVVEALASQQVVLVLDSCEHVLADVGDLVRRIVRWCPGIRVLATSREPLGVPGEMVWPVGPLAVPARTDRSTAAIAASPAVQVFVARAADAVPGFVLTDGDAPAVAEVCRRLDGVPLALELAAARMSAMAPAQLAERLGERFALLDGGRGREPRHRSLRDVVRWSYDLLDGPERAVFADLSVFAGAFELDAAEQVCAAGGSGSPNVAGTVADLVDKSLVVAERFEAGVRYRLLDTLRQFGAERLGELDPTGRARRAHIATFVGRAERGGAALDGPDESAWSARLDGELGDLRAAVLAAVAAGDADSALRLTAATSELAFRRIRYELVDWAEAASALDGAAEHPLQPTVLAVVAYGAFVRGELDRAVATAERAVERGQHLGVPSCGLPERVLGNALIYRGEQDQALAWMDRMVEVARAADRPGRLAHALYMRSVAQTSVGDPAGGAALAAELTSVAQACASPTALAHAAYARGLAVAETDPDRALEDLVAAADLAGSAGNRWLRAFAQTEALWLRARRGESAAALAGYREVVETWARGGDWANQWLSLRQLAGVLAGAGLDEEAALLFGAVDAAGAAAALPLAPSDADERGQVVAEVAGRLGQAAMAEALRRGAALRDDAAVATALAAIDRVA